MSDESRDETFDISEGDLTEPTADAAPASADQSLLRERDELKDRLLRMTADYQNFVRRSEQGLQTARELQLLEVARDLMPVLDNFDHALATEATSASPADLLKGLKMVQESLMTVLTRHGLTRVEVTPGQEFDANLHEALMRQPAEGIPSNHITLQFQPGYTLGARVVRPAKVAVAE